MNEVDKVTCQPGKNISRKMLAIMNEVQYIQKTGHNKFHNYTYAKESDISKAFSEAFSKHNVFMYTSIDEYHNKSFETKKGEHRFLTNVRIKVTFMDIDSGESHEAFFEGDGADEGDKGVYKAITGALKYALLKTFMVATGDDPEDDSRDCESKSSEKSATKLVSNPVQELEYMISQSSNPVQTRNYILNKLNYNSMQNITTEEANDWLRKLQERNIVKDPSVKYPF